MKYIPILLLTLIMFNCEGMVYSYYQNEEHTGIEFPDNDLIRSKKSYDFSEESDAEELKEAIEYIKREKELIDRN